MKLIGKIIYEKIIKDERYINYCDKYSKDNSIDSNVLNDLLRDYKDFYYLFLKSFVSLYFKDDTNYLSKELQNYKYIGNRKIYLDDTDLVLRHYYSNYNRCRKVIKTIIQKKLRPLNEIRLLKQIYNLDIEDSLIPIMDE